MKHTLFIILIFLARSIFASDTIFYEVEFKTTASQKCYTKVYMNIKEGHIVKTQRNIDENYFLLDSTIDRKNITFDIEFKEKKISFGSIDLSHYKNAKIVFKMLSKRQMYILDKQTVHKGNYDYRTMTISPLDGRDGVVEYISSHKNGKSKVKPLCSSSQ